MELYQISIEKRKGEKATLSSVKRCSGMGGGAAISTFFVESVTTMETKKRDDVNGERIERRGCERRKEYASLLLMPPRPRPSLSLLSSMVGEATAQPPRRGALCVSKNVALIGRSVAVMRYQPPANKRINVKMWRWSRRRKKNARGTERDKATTEKEYPSSKLKKRSRTTEGEVSSSSYRYNASIKHSLPK